MARPTKMTPETLDKLRQAYLIGANDKEAYGYAGISHETFYNYIEKHPEFREKITIWQNEPILKARKTIVDGLDDAKNAQWYLERKRKKEFSTRSELEQTGKDPVAEILKAVGLTGGEGANEQNRSDDESIQSSSEDTA